MAEKTELYGDSRMFDHELDFTNKLWVLFYICTFLLGLWKNIEY